MDMGHAHTATKGSRLIALIAALGIACLAAGCWTVDPDKPGPEPNGQHGIGYDEDLDGNNDGRLKE